MLPEVLPYWGELFVRGWDAEAVDERCCFHVGVYSAGARERGECKKRKLVKISICLVVS